MAENGVISAYDFSVEQRNELVTELKRKVSRLWEINKQISDREIEKKFGEPGDCNQPERYQIPVNLDDIHSEIDKMNKCIKSKLEILHDLESNQQTSGTDERALIRENRGRDRRNGTDESLQIRENRGRERRNEARDSGYNSASSRILSTGIQETEQPAEKHMGPSQDGYNETVTERVFEGVSELNLTELISTEEYPALRENLNEVPVTSANSESSEICFGATFHNKEPQEHDESKT